MFLWMFDVKFAKNIIHSKLLWTLSAASVSAIFGSRAEGAPRGRRLRRVAVLPSPSGFPQRIHKSAARAPRALRMGAAVAAGRGASEPFGLL